MHEAMYYEKTTGGVRCLLCPHRCRIPEGKNGLCGVRRAEGGSLYTLNYGKLSAIHVDPIEKKPLACWRPGSMIFSVGSFGCNMACPFCQNHEISKGRPRTSYHTPDGIVATIRGLDLDSIAYTYNEPTVYYEWMLDTARAAKQAGIANVMVTNGLICSEPLQEILPLMDAFNIDLKTWSDGLYRKLGGTTVEDVLQTIGTAAAASHVEVTLLIVPGFYYDPAKGPRDQQPALEAIEGLLERLRQAAPDVVLHITRYFPCYHMEEPATDVGYMLQVQETARKYFDTVLLGNVR
ncbi:radical SAM protein [Anaerotalea alkaliphila]|uniref:Radical SAM protein n=1 Tax=Anaerotalea alkaliphila TaxID=2662126 RepID=A0A7X5HVH2_9FIRM|nr:radical SAM protein [Anaerotalea alkaliphila]NDL67402.1 radical SAM protein [Anaerotalea alkaliphila]